MTNFNKILPCTLRHEGFYSIHPDDPGGETFRGIARNRHPKWSGWKIIDRKRAYQKFPRNLRYDRKLKDLVYFFYKDNFWSKIQGDRIPSHMIAKELFDTAVNVSPPRAIKFMQRALNIFNREQDLFPDLKVDGIIGSKTLNAISVIKIEDAKLVFWMNIIQGCYYLKITERNSKFEAFPRGWIKRLK